MRTPMSHHPSLFDYRREERPKLYIPAYVWADQLADIPSSHKSVFVLLSSRESGDTHLRTR